MKPVSRWEGDAAAWADQLWAHAKRLSRELAGEDVTQALADSADEVYNAGLDELFDGFRGVPFQRRGALCAPRRAPTEETASAPRTRDVMS